MHGLGPSARRLRAAVSGRLIVITGASRGIGATAAGRLALAGARVILLARSEDDLAVVADRIRARGGSADWIAVDLRDTDAAAAAGARILTEFGAPDVIVSNAGHSIHRSLADYADRFHDVTRTAGVNFLGPVALLLPLLPAMTERGSGHLVSVSSTSVSLPAPGWSVYGASKSAFEAWLRSVAPELLRTRSHHHLDPPATGAHGDERTHLRRHARTRRARGGTARLPRDRRSSAADLSVVGAARRRS